VRRFGDRHYWHAVPVTEHLASVTWLPDPDQP
jgi:hypothetical protein